jgi:hypothetical protein
VEVSLHLPDGTHAFTGLGHWHEQYCPRPFFARPFTYATLRGEHFSFVASKTRSRTAGFGVRGELVTEAADLVIDPPGPERAFRLTLADGAVIDGIARVQHAFSVAIEGQRRPGTVVVADTSAGRLTGLINDWQPDEGKA